jgi:hypothetical protein
MTVLKFIEEILQDPEFQRTCKLYPPTDYEAVIDYILSENCIYSTEEIKKTNSLPDYTCPKIDIIIKELKAATKSINSSSKYEEPEDLKSTIEDIDRALWDTDSTVEKVREDNALLRECAVTWKCKYEELEQFTRGLLLELVQKLEKLD